MRLNRGPYYLSILDLEPGQRGQVEAYLKSANAPYDLEPDEISVKLSGKSNRYRDCIERELQRKFG